MICQECNAEVADTREALVEHADTHRAERAAAKATRRAEEWEEDARRQHPKPSTGTRIAGMRLPDCGNF